ncbi:MAG: UDPGP type 1 family protein [Planctomycetes bacterium]|nr:UDPGP type 1 family protein [Planctomycetota bacterium]
MTTQAELNRLLEPHGQQHLTAFWDELSDRRKQTLAEGIAEIDLDLIAQLYRDKGGRHDVRALLEGATSPPAFRLDADKNRFTIEEARARGTEALRAGQVGVLLVAGGQGTRLGFPHPKGMFPIGPISGKSLFQIHLEKVVALARRHGVAVPLYIMTSPATHAETVEYLAENDRFGLPEEDLTIFRQGTMPAVDASTGRILLADRDRVFASPDGHGGMLAALKRSGALAEMIRRGIRHLFYFQVDNPAVDICRPEFLGYHLLSQSELSTQVVAKTDPGEKVGNVVRVGDRLQVIEYSDLPDEAAQRREADGSLSLWAGSIAVHAMDVEFLRRMAERTDVLPFHYAQKNVPHVDAGGRHVEPTERNAIKFERFIFDLIPLAEGAIVVEVDPRRDFIPLKNAPGERQDTPDWVKNGMTALHAEWLREAGAEVDPGVVVEISPLFALDAGELAEKVPAGTRVTADRYFC